MITRKRYVELTEVANDVMDYLQRAKVKKEEGCIVKELCITLWNLEFPPECKQAEEDRSLTPPVHGIHQVYTTREEQPKRR